MAVVVHTACPTTRFFCGEDRPRCRRNRHHPLVSIKAHSPVGQDVGHVGSKEDINNGKPHAIELYAEFSQGTRNVTCYGSQYKPVCMLDLFDCGGYEN